jgi:putative solute:sodium symporter small subunit
MTFSPPGIPSPSPAQPVGTASAQAKARAAYWRRKRRLTLRLLAVWLLSTFLVIYFARDLNDLKLFGWPLSYYMAAQGLALVYLGLIVIYNRSVFQMEARMQAQLEDDMKAEPHHAA